MLETAQVLGDAGLLDRTLEATRRIADAASEGRCHDGSMIYERHASGAYDNDKHWWVQAENVVLCRPAGSSRHRKTGPNARSDK